jgi:hypothetical protein
MMILLYVLCVVVRSDNPMMILLYVLCIVVRSGHPMMIHHWMIAPHKCFLTTYLLIAPFVG